MKKKSKIILIVIGVLLIGAILGTTLGVYFGVFYDSNRNVDYTARISDFYEGLAAMDYADNDKDSLYLQTELYPKMVEHMYHNTSGKTPMLLFVGYDGMQSAAIDLQKNAENSGVFSLLENGGQMVFARTGGKKVGYQDTSTAPGWATLLTGEWANKTLVATNGLMLNPATRSLVYTLGRDGFKTSFNVIWAPHIKYTYRLEVLSAKTRDYPISYNLGKKDIDTYNTMLERINNNSDRALFCIFEHTDTAGHGYGYSDAVPEYREAVETMDGYAYDLIQAVYNRPTYHEEDWLIVITQDHGGVDKNHGGRTPMEYVTFFVSNKKLFI